MPEHRLKRIRWMIQNRHLWEHLEPQHWTYNPDKEQWRKVFNKMVKAGVYSANTCFTDLNLYRVGTMALRNIKYLSIGN